MAHMIKFILARIIHPTQFGFVHGRHIHEAIFNLLLTMEYALAQNKLSLQLNLDLESAYDRIHWNFMIATITKLGFGEGFTRMVVTLFSNAGSSISTTVTYNRDPLNG